MKGFSIFMWARCERVKIFIRNQSVAMWSGWVLLDLGRGPHSLGDLQNLMRSFSSKDTSLVRLYVDPISSHYVELLIQVLLGFGRGMHSPGDFQNLMGTFLSKDTTMVKIP